MFYYYFHCTVTKSVEDAPFYLVSREKRPWTLEKNIVQFSILIDLQIWFTLTGRGIRPEDWLIVHKYK